MSMPPDRRSLGPHRAPSWVDRIVAAGYTPAVEETQIKRGRSTFRRAAQVWEETPKMGMRPKAHCCNAT